MSSDAGLAGIDTDSINAAGYSIDQYPAGTAPKRCIGAGGQHEALGDRPGSQDLAPHAGQPRSEERRVGNESRLRGSPEH